MNKAHKIAKYFAIAFAASLIFGMIMLAVNIVDAIIPISNIGKSNNDSSNITSSDVISEISNLDIELRASDLVIKEGEKFRVDVNNKYVNVVETGNKLSIIEQKHKALSDFKGIITVYIPINTNFNKVEISNGAGSINIDSLTTSGFDLEVGAGKVEIDTLTVLNKADIEGGAGKISISNGSINNLDLDIGVGECNLSSLLTGNSDIESGIGSVNISLLNSKDNYKIKATKGIGTINIDNTNISNDTIYGNVLT